MEKKTLMITGGTGSFGEAVSKLSLDLDLFKEVRIFSRDEKKQDDMRRKYNNSKLSFYIGDIRDKGSLESAMHGVDYVFHAAALKQVPSCEFFPMEAVKTNIIGTENIIKCSKEYGVKKLIVLSTDKAAYPINAMGMSKALMEKVAISHSSEAASMGLTISCTRYGNVMGSRGSVIPRFMEQIEKGRDITITDPAMTRFMMTLSDAVELVLFAFEHARPGDLFVQKAPAATVETLAKAIQKVMKADNRIRIIGVRHGEKLYETLLTREEKLRSEDMGNYFRVSADLRTLNYDQFFVKGNTYIHKHDEYHSHNTQRLNVDETCTLLKKIGFNDVKFT